MTWQGVRSSALKCISITNTTFEKINLKKVTRYEFNTIIDASFEFICIDRRCILYCVETKVVWCIQLQSPVSTIFLPLYPSKLIRNILEIFGNKLGNHRDKVPLGKNDLKSGDLVGKDSFWGERGK